MYIAVHTCLFLAAVLLNISPRQLSPREIFHPPLLCHDYIRNGSCVVTYVMVYLFSKGYVSAEESCVQF